MTLRPPSKSSTEEAGSIADREAGRCANIGRIAGEEMHGAFDQGALAREDLQSLR